MSTVPMSNEQGIDQWRTTPTQYQINIQKTLTERQPVAGMSAETESEAENEMT